ncbi:MAG TPA: spore coat U domain-containing protein [Gammaproteobacteria bacterium]|nr:spore coat U domain-containing protein [Gammaproteobacteria bacterium]
MRNLSIVAISSIMLLSVSIAHAATCTVATNNFNFGNYDVMNAAATIVTGTNLITVKCTRGKGTMTVDLSTGGSGNYFPRAMKSGTNILTYNLYTTASLTTVWGNGTGGTADVVQTFKNKSTTTLNVYGQIAAQQNVVPGAYGDSITVTVSF